MQSLSDYAAGMKSQSTVQNPIRRLAAHGVMSGSAPATIVFRGPDGKLAARSYTGKGAPVQTLILDEVIEQIVEELLPFAVDSRRTMNDLLDRVRRSAVLCALPQPLQITTMNGLNASSRIPQNPFALIVSEAIASTYWIPGDTEVERIDFAAKAFGDVFAQIDTLQGRPTRAQDSFAANYKKAAAGLIKGRSAMQYRAATRAGEMRTLYVAVDVLGHKEGMLTGDVTIVEPLTKDGSKVVVGLHNSTRLKPNKKVGVYDRGLDKVGDAQLVEFGYDNSRDMVTAVIQTTGQAKSALGYRQLFQMAGTGETFLLADIPFTGEKNGGYGHWSNAHKMTPIVRDVPLAIALAAAKIR